MSYKWDLGNRMSASKVVFCNQITSVLYMFVYLLVSLYMFCVFVNFLMKHILNIVFVLIFDLNLYLFVYLIFF